MRSVAILMLSVWGVVLAFQASIVLGVLCLIVEPAPLILGVAALFDPEIAQKVANWLGL